MVKRFRISTVVLRKLEDLGVRPAAVLRQAGLPVALLQQPKPTLTTEEFFTFWRGADEVSGDPMIGLHIGAEDRIERFDPIAIAALYSRTLDEALQCLARYKRMSCPEDIVLHRGSKECSVQFQFLLANDAEPGSLIDLCFAWVLSIARRGLADPISPLRVELARPSHARKRFREFFGCPVTFESAQNRMVFRRSDLERPFVTSNAELHAMIAPHLEAELTEHVRHVSPVQDQVRQVIKRRLAGQRPNIVEVARELGTSSRTLQRRLTEAGLKFQQLLEDARRELARQYLTHSDLELTETAYLLGYEDASSFVRAFHEWEGVPPGQWRETQRSGFAG